MNTPAKRAAAMGRLNRAIKKIRELHAMRDWLAMGAALAAYWDAKREWEGGMSKPEIHDDDYNELEYEHSLALRDIQSLSIMNFGLANDVLMKLQDKAYQLGMDRGKKESGSTELLDALEEAAEALELAEFFERAVKARAAIAKARGEQ